jgi:hypothetical protein
MPDFAAVPAADALQLAAKFLHVERPETACSGCLEL